MEAGVRRGWFAAITVVAIGAAVATQQQRIQGAQGGQSEGAKQQAMQSAALGKGPATGHLPVLPFTPTDFLKFPVDRYLGEPIAIARNSKGHLFVFHRAGTEYN